MLPCNHEEANSRMYLHVKDASEKGPDLHLWVGFGTTGKYFRYYCINDIRISG